MSKVQTANAREGHALQINKTINQKIQKQYDQQSRNNTDLGRRCQEELPGLAPEAEELRQAAPGSNMDGANPDAGEGDGG